MRVHLRNQLLCLASPRRGILLVVEFQADAVDTMPLVGRRGVTLSLEDMAQVPSAIRTHNLGALHAKGRVRMSGYGAGNTVEIRGPAASRLELVVRRVQRCVAAGAGVDTGGWRVFIVFARERRFCALFPENPELFCRARVLADGLLHFLRAMGQKTYLCSTLFSTPRSIVHQGTTSFRKLVWKYQRMS